MVVIDRFSVLLGQGKIDLIGVHNGGEDIVLAVHLYGKLIGFGVKPLGVFIAAVGFKIVGVDV